MRRIKSILALVAVMVALLVSAAAPAAAEISLSFGQEVEETGTVTIVLSVS